MKSFFIFSLILFYSYCYLGYIFAQQFSTEVIESSLHDKNNDLYAYEIPDSILQKFPYRNQNYLNRFYPGVVSYFQNFYIRGGRNFETGFFLDGMKFNDLFTGDNSFFIHPNIYDNIDFYNGFVPSEFGNVSSGLFNYQLKTGGKNLDFNIEHQTDNITFTNDAYSGKKRLGAYYYGYNETNLSFGGPLYFENVRFFTNVNYLFMRDKNPQRYPGVDNLLFYDFNSADSITINLPAGIVPYNSLESFNLISTLLFDLRDIKIKASGGYFDENEYTERNHLLEYLNPRLGLIDKTGGFVNINLSHKISEIISYSISGSYFQKINTTSDQYLGDNYWSYGDSVANANAGVKWQREGNNYGRYILPFPKYIMTWKFPNINYPGIDYKKSDQQRISVSGNLRLTLNTHLVRFGGEFNLHNMKYWDYFHHYGYSFASQALLARWFAEFRNNSDFDQYIDEALKEYILQISGVNNFGYDPNGNEADAGFYKAPRPMFISLYLDDQFNIINNLRIYLGLKYDLFDFDYKKLVDPASPEKSFDPLTLEITNEGLIKTENFSFISPKVHINFFPLNNLSIDVIYSQNIQSHPFLESYQGFHSVAFNLGTGFLSSPPVYVKQLKPIRSSIYELQLSFIPIENMKTRLNYYYKHSKNLSSVEIQKANSFSPYSSYFYYSDNGNLDIWGIDFQVDYYHKGFTILSNICYQYLRDVHQEDQFNSVRSNTLLSYNFYQIQNISSIFDKLNLSMVFSLNSGHPYYLEASRGVHGPLSGTTPNVYQLDLKFEKGFSIFSNFNLNFYVYVINLLDTKNVYDVFPRTGSADNDGYLSDPDLGGQLVEIYGEQFVTLYNLLLKYNPLDEQQTFYGPPRQIGFGINVNY